MKNGFPARLQQFLKAYGLTSSELAQKLGVQKSSISHLLSGRNKPSFDFLSKFARTFPEINLRWLLTGEGDMHYPTPAVNEKNKETENETAGKENPQPETAWQQPDNRTATRKPVQLTIPFFDDTPVELIKVYADGTYEILKKRSQ